MYFQHAFDSSPSCARAHGCKGSIGPSIPPYMPDDVVLRVWIMTISFTVNYFANWFSATRVRTFATTGIEHEVPLMDE